MKISIDDKVCLKHGLTLEEVLIILSLRNSSSDYNEDVSNLIARDIIVIHNGDYKVTQHWSDIVDEILCDSTDEHDEGNLLNLAKQMRECFPAGKMVGTPYYYRCNNKEVINKLKKFFIQYGDYSNEDIIKATKKFVSSFKGDYRFMPLIKYFISKNKTVYDENGEGHIQEVSELASYLENMDNEEDIPEVSSSDDWLVSARN